MPLTSCSRLSGVPDSTSLTKAFAQDRENALCPNTGSAGHPATLGIPDYAGSAASGGLGVMSYVIHEVRSAILSYVPLAR